MTSPKIAVLVMAYGTPRSLDDDEIYAYLRHITQFYRGADPDPDRVHELTERYRSIGLTSLYDITHQVYNIASYFAANRGFRDKLD